MLNVGWFTAARRRLAPGRRPRPRSPLSRSRRTSSRPPSERILVDTGLHPAAVDDAARHYGTPDALGAFQLELDASVGEQVDLATITKVVLTHLHFDHAGGLRAAAALGPGRRAAPRMGGGPRRGGGRAELLPARRLRAARRPGRARRRRPRPARRRLGRAAADAGAHARAPIGPRRRAAGHRRRRHPLRVAASTTTASRSSATTSPRRQHPPTACARFATPAHSSSRGTTRPC